MKVLPEVILPHGSLVYKYIFLGVIPVDEIISVSYIQPCYCSQNIPWDHLLVSGSRCCQCESTQGLCSLAAACGAGLDVGSTEGGDSRLLLGLGLAAHGYSKDAWGWLRQLRLLPSVMVTGPEGSSRAAQGSMGSALRSRYLLNSVDFILFFKSFVCFCFHHFYMEKLHCFILPISDRL